MYKISDQIIQNVKSKKFAFLITCAFLFSLYSYVAISSYGFDDEYWNIGLIESGKSLYEIFSYVQLNDIHPPLSYVFNYYLFRLFGSWSLVRLTISILLVLSIIRYSLYTWDRKGWLVGIKSLLFVGLNPSLLMWGTSIRWYSLYLIIICWMLVIPYSKSNKYNFFWLHSKIVIALLLLGYTNYLTIIFAIPFVILYYWQIETSKNSRIKFCITSLVIFSILYSHQIYIFFTYHYINRSSQLFSLSRSLIGLITSQFSNQGVFPISIIGIISIISMGILFVISVLESIRKKSFININFFVYISTLLLLIASGLAGKFRGFVTIDILKGIWLSEINLFSERKLVSRLSALALTLVLFSQICGCLNVIKHSGTTKNNWNIPYKEVMNRIGEFSAECSGKMVVLTYDPTFQWHLNRLGYLTKGPYRNFGNFSPEPNNKYSYSPAKPDEVDGIADCIIILKTFRGYVNKEEFESMQSEVRYILKGHEYEFEQLGFDKYYRLKKLLQPRFPSHNIEIIISNGKFDLSELKSW